MNVLTKCIFDGHYNKYKFKTIGKDQIITNINDQVKTFESKLDLWNTQLENED